MKKLLITLLIGITCTTITLPPVYSFASCIEPTASTSNKDSYKERSSIHIDDLQDELSIINSTNITDVDFLIYEIALFRTSIYLSALIQGYTNDEQLIDFAGEILQENSGVTRESRILIDKLTVSEKKDTADSAAFIKSTKEIAANLSKNLDSINYTENDSLIYLNQMMYILSSTKDLANLILKTTKDATIKKIAEDIINNADSNLETIKEIKPAFS